ncbi:MAG: MATE family efflux transporter [Gammaproteobacteria bacterium]|nr:MATE family efflux transporter [Gammaproteobacteria bacterium]
MSTQQFPIETSPVAPGRRRRAIALLRQAIAGEETDYTQGRVGRAVLLLAIPMMLEMAMESVFAVVDIFFVARLGAEAVAAVGLTEAMLTLLYAVAVGLSMAVTALVARRIGEKRADAAAVVAGQTLWVGIAVSVAVGVAGVLYARDLLVALGADAAVVESGTAYTAWMLGGCASIVLLFLLNAVFRGAGNAALAMRVLWLANGINIVLDPCLIFGWGPFPELGVAGAAIATNIGRGVGALYALYCLIGGNGVLRLRAAHVRIARGVLAGLLRVSAGGIAQFAIATSSYIVLMRIVSDYGSAAIAGYTIAIRIVMFTLLPAWGLSNAAATLVGQNLGAGQPQRAEDSVRSAARYNLMFLLAIAAVFIVFARPLVGIFSTEPDVLANGAACLRIISYGYGFYAVGMIAVQAFNGAGDTSTPTWVNLIFFWLLQLPLASWLAGGAGLGPRGVFWAIAISESLMAVAAVLLFRRGRWKRKVV